MDNFLKCSVNTSKKKKRFIKHSCLTKVQNYNYTEPAEKQIERGDTLKLRGQRKSLTSFFFCLAPSL